RRIVATQRPSIAPSPDLPRPAVEGGVNVRGSGPERDILRSSRPSAKFPTLWRTPQPASEQPPIKMTRLNPSSDVGALSPARPVAGVEAVASAAAPRGRMALLERLNGEKRGVDPKKLLDAVLLRRLGEDDYDKNEWNKLVPGVVERVRMRFGTFH